MADKKISALTPATIPLAGTEVLPIVQSGSTVKVASDNLTVKNLRSNATTGILQVAGPAAAATRTMTVPDANFTAARTDAGQTFTGDQTFATQSITANAAAVNFGTSATGQIFSGGTDATKYAGMVLRGANSWNTFFGRIPDAVGDNVAFGNDNTGSYGNILVFGANDITVSRGNLVIGTSGKGIDFSATGQAAGMTSELLADYEEGTWTPSLGGDTTYNDRYGYYTKTGNFVFANFLVNVNTLGTGSTTALGGLPFVPPRRGDGSLNYFQNINANVYWISCYATTDGNIYFPGQTGLDAFSEDGIAIFKDSTYIIGVVFYLV